MIMIGLWSYHPIFSMVPKESKRISAALLKSFLRNTEWTSRFGALEAQLIYELGRERNAGRPGVEVENIEIFCLGYSLVLPWK